MSGKFRNFAVEIKKSLSYDAPSNLPPPIQTSDNQQYVKKKRDSNLELFRIITMLLIIAHHYVVNSDVLSVIRENPSETASGFLMLFGAWGKTGINCFVLITGYFMCKSSISLHKFLKLVTQVLFYNLLIFAVFVVVGLEDFSMRQLLSKILVVKNMNGGFTSGFIMFYLFIPFLTVLVNNLTRRQHLMLVGLVLLTFTVLGSMPPALGISVSVNYVLHFCNLFIIASYVRLHGFPVAVSHRMWGLGALLSLLAGCAMVLFMLRRFAVTGAPEIPFGPYYWISDSNKILAMSTAFCAFMWFKDLKLGYSRVINALGGATFGVLLIHANSSTMRQWLWNELVDCAGHFTDPLLWVYAPACVIAIFLVCASIDILRARFVEGHILKWSNRAALGIKRALPV